MYGKTHALYLLSIFVFIASVVLPLNFGFRGVSDENPPLRIVLLPFQATDSIPSVASYHLMNGLLWELSKIADVTVTHPNDVIPSIRKAQDFPSWLRDEDESQVLIGSVSGPEERLTINIIVFDTRARSVDRVLEKTLITNLYNLEHAYEALAVNVVSMADRHSPNRAGLGQGLASGHNVAVINTDYPDGGIRCIGGRQNGQHGLARFGCRIQSP